MRKGYTIINRELTTFIAGMIESGFEPHAIAYELLAIRWALLQAEQQAIARFQPSQMSFCENALDTFEQAINTHAAVNACLLAIDDDVDLDLDL